MQVTSLRQSVVILCTAIGAMIATVAFAQGDIVTTKKLSWRLAVEIATEAMSACEAQGYAVTVSVVDSGGNQQALIKSDLAPAHTVSVAYRKAYTAYAYGFVFGMGSTGELIAAGKTGPANGALNTIPNVLFLPGGATIRSGKDVLGGIGVSGAPGGEKDEACALAALAKYKARIE